MSASRSFLVRAANIAAFEAAAAIADVEAVRFEAFANEMREQIARAPRRGLKWRLKEYEAGAQAARRIAEAIRAAKAPEEEG